ELAYAAVVEPAGDLTHHVGASPFSILPSSTSARSNSSSGGLRNASIPFAWHARRYATFCGAASLSTRSAIAALTSCAGGGAVAGRPPPPASPPGRCDDVGGASCAPLVGGLVGRPICSMWASTRDFL